MPEIRRETLAETVRPNGHAVKSVAVEEHNNETDPLLSPVLDYLKSERGHQLANRGLDFLESLKKATLDEQAKTKALQSELAKIGMKHTMLIQTIGLVVVVGSIVVLSATVSLRGEAATILGALAGYLFAQKKDAG